MLFYNMSGDDIDLLIILIGLIPVRIPLRLLLLVSVGLGKRRTLQGKRLRHGRGEQESEDEGGGGVRNAPFRSSLGRERIIASARVQNSLRTPTRRVRVSRS